MIASSSDGTKVAAVPRARSLSGGGDPDGLKLVYMAIQKASIQWMLPRGSLWRRGSRAVSGAGIAMARKHAHAGSAFSTLRNELKQDVNLVKESI